MELKVLGSSSAGNSYILDNGKEALLIEAGISFKNIKKALDFNLRKVVGCLITHQHNDHAKYIKTIVDSGINTLALPEVWAAKGVTGSRSVSIEVGKAYVLGNFKVIPFEAAHDVPCVGYLINHPETGSILFLTDSYMCEYRFNNLKHILIECNYSDQQLMKAIQDGRTQPFQRERLLTSHLEFHTCKEVLKANDLTNVEEVVLIHLSENNADEQYFVNEIQKMTGKAVYAAHPGMILDFNS